MTTKKTPADLKHLALMGECWAGHEGFRKLGFTPDDIKVYCGPVGGQRENCLCAVVGEGKNLFVYVAGPVGETPVQEIYDEWTAFVSDVLPQIPEPELQKFYVNSYVGTPEKLQQMITGLIIKNIPIPNIPVTEEERKNILAQMPAFTS